MAARIQRLRPQDLDAAVALEEACFEPARRASRRSLARSLEGQHQSVWGIRGRRGLVALLVLWHRRRTVRIYDVAVHPTHQGRGIGRRLVEHTLQIAVRDGAARVALEARQGDERLAGLYQRLGFQAKATKLDFYGPGLHAIRYVRSIESGPT